MIILLSYLLTKLLVKELGIGEDNRSNQNIYISVTKSNYETFLKGKFHITLDSYNPHLPHIYWLPNFRKNPFQCKFVFDATRYSFKPLLKDVTSVLKFLHPQIGSYNEKSFYILGVETIWPIQIRSI